MIYVDYRTLSQILVTVVFLCISLLSADCKSNASQGVPEDWLGEAGKQETHDERLVEIGLYDVLPRSQAWAVDQLTDRWFKELSLSQADAIAVNAKGRKPSGVPFLVRCVGRQEGDNGDVLARMQGDCLLILVGIIEGDTLTKRPVIVYLDKAPAGELVDLSIYYPALGGISKGSMAGRPQRL